MQRVMWAKSLISGQYSTLLGSGRRQRRMGASNLSQSLRTVRHPAFLDLDTFSLSSSSSSASLSASPPSLTGLLASSGSRSARAFPSSRDHKSGSTATSVTPPRGSGVGARQKGQVTMRRRRTIRAAAPLRSPRATNSCKQAVQSV